MDQLDQAGHVIQLYEDQAYLGDVVTRFVGAGLGAGDGVIVIATEAHRARIEQQLSARGLDLATARSEGRYTALDAPSLLAQFMVDGMPDYDRFREAVSPAMVRAGAQQRPVRAFGEMVALLAAEGNYDAAVRLEELWNVLAEERTFSLLCAYPLTAFNRESNAEPFRTVCAMHVKVIPAESYPLLADAETRRRLISELQQKAAALEGEVAARDAFARSATLQAESLEHFFENAPTAIHYVGPDGTILRANPAELKLLGYAPEEYVGHYVGTFHVDQPVIEDILQRLRCGEIVRDRKARLLCKDGSIKSVLIDANVRWEDGKFLHTRCFTRDISERERDEKERRELLRAAERARAEAEAANCAKDEFLSVVSHELRTPLAAMLGWVAVLNNAASLDERGARAVASIERSGRAQAKLIEDLLDVSRIVSGRMRLDLRLVDLPAIIRGALETVRPAADAKGVGIEARIDPTAGPVAGDTDRLQQIAWNLLSNAVKFTPAGGLVSITLQRREHDVRLAVHDTGRGIAADFLPFVFERFRQGAPDQARQGGGLGLGLAIVRHLAELHGGEVEAASEGEGTGATFTVTLPLTPLRLQIRDDRRGAMRLLDGVHAVVVEDDDGARAGLRQILEAHGASVTKAGSVEDARNVLEKNTPDILISDIRLGDESAYSLLREMRAHPALRRVPAIAVTGLASEGGRRALDAGFQVRLAKPVDAELLITAISKLTSIDDSPGSA